MTLCIRALVPADLDAAETLLTEAYGRPDEWRAELACYLALQPEGWFVATLNHTIVGMGGTHDYGPFASIGLMATHPAVQRQGIATALLDHVASWLRDRQCPVAVLDASVAGAPVYQRYGFRDQGITALFREETRGTISPPPHRVRPMSPSDIPEVVAFDSPLFGADRTAVLTASLTAAPGCAFLVRDGLGDVSGYLFARSRKLGPWTASTPADAEALLDTALTLPLEGPLTVLVPDANPHAPTLLAERGFAQQRGLRHMYLGAAAPAQDRSRIYGQTSFAIG